MGTDDEPVQFIQWRALKDEIRSVVAWGIGSSVPGTAVGEAVTAGWSQGTLDNCNVAHPCGRRRSRYP
jgi:hypothetical protein